MIDRTQLIIEELESAKKLLDEFIERHKWNSAFRRRELNLIIAKLTNVEKNLF
jgi:hypothetical protein